MSELKKNVDALKTFHNDEDGLETVQVVMIVAIAAIILIVLLKFWGQIKTWVKEQWDALKGDSAGAKNL